MSSRLRPAAFLLDFSRFSLLPPPLSIVVTALSSHPLRTLFSRNQSLVFNMMNRMFVLGLAAAGLVSAKATVTSMFIYDADPQPLAASIMGNVRRPDLKSHLAP